MSDTTIPPGYWANAKGVLFPVSTISAIDKDRTKVVTEAIEQAKAMSSQLLAFKLAMREHINAFLDRSAARCRAMRRCSATSPVRSWWRWRNAGI